MGLGFSWLAKGSLKGFKCSKCSAGLGYCRGCITAFLSGVFNRVL